jgi:hypothetical protein
MIWIFRLEHEIEISENRTSLIRKPASELLQVTPASLKGSAKDNMKILVYWYHDCYIPQYIHFSDSAYSRYNSTSCHSLDIGLDLTGLDRNPRGPVGDFIPPPIVYIPQSVIDNSGKGGANTIVPRNIRPGRVSQHLASSQLQHGTVGEIEYVDNGEFLYITQVDQSHGER